MFDKILIANRGEIACRIIKTAKRLGIHTVAVFSEADSNALHVKLADEAHLIGGATSQDSYLNAQKIVETAKLSGASAIHPGYGFLAENAHFAKLCEAVGITFIGPTPAAIEAMGSKSEAKAIMAAAKVPILPGYHGKTQTLEKFKTEAETVGYPILLKAVAGGGGKGMRIVRDASELETAMDATKRESLSSFGDDTLLIEKYLEKPRHIEIQVFGDQKGKYVYLFERDCSIQRRQQKIIEEAPAAGLSGKLRTALGKAAIKAAKIIKYQGAGTVEFLLDEDGKFYFMEMNTRLQVEHPVTEMICGVDLVEWQIAITAGKSLPKKQKELVINGHAIEVRLYAEDPYQNFIPSIGHLTHWNMPQDSLHVRLDSGVKAGDAISMHYDPMLAKLIVWDETREATIFQLQNALQEAHIAGVKSNLSLLRSIAHQSAFINGEYNTFFIEQYKEQLFPGTTPFTPKALALAALYVLLTQEQEAASAEKDSKDATSPWNHCDAWQLNSGGHQILRLTHDEKEFALPVEHYSDYYEVYCKNGNKTIRISGELNNSGQLHAEIDGQHCKALIIPDNDDLHIITEASHQLITLYSFSKQHDEYSTNEHQLSSPMPGTVVALLTEPSKSVHEGDGLIVIEAMKMEQTILAPADGTVTLFHYAVGDIVDEGVELLEFSPLEEQTQT